MPICQLVYGSRPFGFDQPMLNAILASARRHNRRNGVTGALICRADLFLQWLEGPRDRVTETFVRIAGDDRHADLHLIWTGEAQERLFPDWDMLDDPARSWMWTRGQVDHGALASATSDDARAIFRLLANQTRERAVS